jgi:Tfp pilus assembly protein PilZ
MFERQALRVIPRKPVRVEIGVPDRAPVTGLVANVSEQGACVVTDGEFPVGENFVIVLHLSPDAAPLRAAGRVVWMKPASDAPGAQRYGLEWVDRGRPQQIHVQEFILAVVSGPGPGQAAEPGFAPAARTAAREPAV